jgi:hypothetical protein
MGLEPTRIIAEGCTCFNKNPGKPGGCYPMLHRFTCATTTKSKQIAHCISQKKAAHLSGSPLNPLAKFYSLLSS